MIPRPKCGRKLLFSRVENFQPAGIKKLESSLAFDYMQRRAFLRARFSQREHSTAEFKGRQATCLRCFGAVLVPVQPPGNHQVQNEPQIAFDTDTDAFTEPPQPSDFLAFHTREWRHGGAQQKRTRDSNALQPGALNSLLESFDVNSDVRQFRH